MKWRSGLAGLLIAFSTSAVMALPVWDSRDGHILPPSQANKLLQQCSRDVPKDVTGFWFPMPKQIAELEMRLPAVLGKALQARQASIPNYLRQYVGLVSHGRKIIYVNGFLADEIFPGDGRVRSTDWRNRAVVVCDGGSGYFGVEYQPQSRIFSGLAFNGAA